MRLATPSPRFRPLSLFLCYAMLSPYAPMTSAASGAKAAGTRKASAPPAATSSPSGLPKRKGDGRAGELLVRFRAGVADEEAGALAESKGIRRQGRLRGESGVERIAVVGGRDVEAVAAELRSSALVEFAEPNFMITADQLTPDDPRFPEQWALRNTGERGGPAGADINSASAWAQTTGSPRTVVAVVDGGVDFTHPDLRNNRWANPKERANGRDDDGDGFTDDLHGWDWVDDSKEIRDVRGHGTSVASVIAAEGNNASGVAGVMWRAGLMSLRVLDSSGKGTVADAVEAIDYAVAHGAQVINCSWGLDEPSEVLRDALMRAGRSGTLIVIAAGNAGRSVDKSPRYPASFNIPAALSVGSTNASDEITPWSNWGAASVQLAAPGEGILTARAGGGYDSVSGTSVSAALVSGVAGLVRTLRPRLSAARTREVILRGVRRVAGLDGRVSSGGVLDANGALAETSALPPEEGKGNSDGEEGEEDEKEDGDGKKDGKKSSAPTATTGTGHNQLPTTVPPVPSLGARGDGLPDLDSLRPRRPDAPRAVAPVASTRRRCPPHNPRCNEPGDGLLRLTPTPVPTPRHRSQTGQSESFLASLALPSLLTAVTSLTSRHLVFPASASDYYLGGAHSVTDSSPALLAPYAAVAAAQTGEVYLSNLNWTYSHNDYYSTTRDLTVSGAPLKLNGVTYQKGLGVHAFADVRFHLGGNYQTFTSDVGLDDAATSAGSVTFEVWADGTKLYDSGVMLPTTATKNVSVSVAGRQELKLIVTQAGDGPGWDHADWAGARLASATDSANVALGKPATQSSTYGPTVPAARAVDGNTAGTHAAGTISHTNSQPQAWWQVDLGGNYSISQIKVWNRADCCTQFTSNFYVLVSDQPFASTDLAATLSQAGVSSYHVAGEAGAPTGVAVNRTGRYVRVQLAGTNYLTLSEVEVMGTAAATNVALGKAAAQSSTFGANVPAARAVDGTTSGSHAAGTISHTNNDAQAWWQVDLGQVHSLTDVRVWNRADCCTSMTSNFYVLVSDQPFTSTDLTATLNQAGVSNYHVSGAAGTPTSVMVGRTGRYVRVQLAGTNYLTLSEVEVYGVAASQMGNGLTGKYYDNIDLTGYKLTRTDPKVDFEWHSAAPDPSVGPDTFSAVWTGMVSPRHSETYTFYAQADDGVRLWVDGQILIDKWIDQGWTEWSGTITLEADRQYSIRMEYYENGGGAIAKLLWSSPSQAKEVIPQSRLYGCWKSSDQFARDFYQGALNRQPNSAESQEWVNRLMQAQGEAQLIAEARGLGRALFNSQEYINRNRTNRQYVEDLYRGYLQREPDESGLNYWVGVVNSDPFSGRENVLAAFEASGEFREKVKRLCGTSASVGEAGYNFSTARLDPSNATGSTDPLSRNFNWSLPLLRLKGRTGLDLGLTLSYNSLVWTKDAAGGGITFDADRGFPSPGFRLGFPVIHPRFFNRQTGKNAYMLITPSGARVELRQVGTSNTYESGDSSYLQLADHGGGSLTLRATDGTRLSFSLIYGEYHCVEVKDRNGNYLTINRDGYGQITNIIDTLGRAITFNYDSFQNLVSITQAWKRELDNGTNANETHQWATFGYENLTLQPGFANLAVMGAQPGTVIPVIRRVGLGDGSYYRFDYTPWGQVYKITHFAADSVAGGVAQDTHPLSHVRYDVPGSDLVAATPQTDCPRFTEQREWAEYGVGDIKQSQEVVTTYTPWTADAPACKITAPDGTLLKEFYATSGWKKGLTTQSEVWSAGQRKKWTTLAWTQDNLTLGYAENPRVEETNVYDPEGNRRRTEVVYTSYGLPAVVREYKADASTVLRRMETDYRIDPVADAAYLNNRIIGLVKESRLYDEAGTLSAKVGYVYDDTGEAGLLQALPSAATNHDAGYGTSFTVRGNLNRVRRYDVNSPTTFVESRVGYNVTGSPVFTKDASGHKTSIGYADSFYANVNRSNPLLQTFAYATSVTTHETVPAAVEVMTTTAYNYDFGAPVTVAVPKGGIRHFEAGPATKTYYDAAGRVRKVVNLSTNTHTEWVYPPSMDYVQTFSTVGDESVSNPARRAYAATALTGDGRVRGMAKDLPVPGQAGRYTGTRVLYDVMGRVEYQSNPAEMTAAGGVWTPAGDDYNDGQWRWARQQYDWRGRPTVRTNVDGTTQEALYGGCGCAGGEVATTRDEVGRRRRVTFDVLGRAWKSQVLSVQDKAQLLSHGADADVYSTVTNTYNARDQITLVTEQAGTSGASQATSVEYDGHGRVSRRHAPEQEAGRFTTYTYFPDDTVETVTDARGAKATYAYNARHLPLSVTYDISGVMAGQNVATTPNVTFTYDAAGNRLSMDDGPGRVDYSYDTLSRLLSETRQFDGLGSYPTTYSYTLAGALKSVRDHTNNQIDYAYDEAGRLTGVTGSPYAGVSTYASNFQYRAWGALKSVTYGDGRTHARGYDARLRLSGFEIAGPSAQGPPQVMKAAYQYHADGRIRFMDDQLDSRFDRGYDYDLAGRLSRGLSGAEARAFASQPVGDGAAGSYSQTYAHDVWDNLTAQAGEHWGRTQSFTASYTHHRRAGWAYDASGRVVADDSRYQRRMTYDAAGRNTEETERQRRGGGRSTLTVADLRLTQSYDGEGRRARREEHAVTRVNNGSPQTSVETTYYVRSSVLGGRAVAELNSEGQKQKGYVYAAGEVVVKQWAGHLYWQQQNPVTGSARETSTEGYTYASEGNVELDPQGRDVGAADPYALEEEMGVADYSGTYEVAGNGFDESGHGCEWDGMPIKCEVLGFVSRTHEVAGLGVRRQGNETPGFGVGLVTRRWVQGGTSSTVTEGDIEYGPGVSDDEVDDSGFVWDLNGDTLLLSTGDATLGRRLVLRRTQNPAPQAPSDCASALAAITPGLVGEHAGLLLGQGQQQGLSAAQLAYVFASAQHETDQGNTMTEYASGRAYNGRTDLGNTQPGDGPRYKGRGFVQLTGRNNYQKYTDLLDQDLIGNPDLATDPQISAFITVHGMMNGTFTGKRLNRYINDRKTDFRRARRTVNGLDRARKIAGYANKYLNALKNCGY